MIDIHVHILPGIDDGPTDDGNAIEMARAMVDVGIDRAVATPHLRRELGWENQREQIIAAVQRFKEALNLAGVPLEVLPGAEHFCDAELFEDLATGRATPLALQRYILVEFQPRALPPDLPGFLYRMRRAGQEPLLAHIERYPTLCDNRTLLDALCDQGYPMHIDIGALVGEEGRGVKKLAWRLLEERRAQIVATDAHSALHLRAVPKALLLLNKRLGEDRARELLISNPAAVVAGQPLS